MLFASEEVGTWHGSRTWQKSEASKLERRRKVDLTSLRIATIGFPFYMNCTQILCEEPILKFLQPSTTQGNEHNLADSQTHK